MLAVAGATFALFAVLLAAGGTHGRARTHARTHAADRQSVTRATHRSRSSAAQAASATPTAAGERREEIELHRLIALGRPVYCAPARGHELALTFDDGPGPYTRLVLDKLRKHSVRATFFDVGRNIGQLPNATARERAIGVVGDHTFTHPDLTTLAPAAAEREIVGTQRALARASGGAVSLFRPPYGAHDRRIDAIARAHGLLEILWSVDSADSLGANYAQIARNVIAGLRPGAIILMHENHGQTVRALLAIFAALARRHLSAVSVPQLLAADPPSVAALRSGGSGCAARAPSPHGGG
jgi:peptidoglycan/xylan/chitin deacetylase (PgdA/CDA1 family)